MSVHHIHIQNTIRSERIGGATHLECDRVRMRVLKAKRLRHLLLEGSWTHQSSGKMHVPSTCSLRLKPSSTGSSSTDMAGAQGRSYVAIVCVGKRVADWQLQRAARDRQSSIWAGTADVDSLAIFGTRNAQMAGVLLARWCCGERARW
jgi:hypothetical protein